MQYGRGGTAETIRRVDTKQGAYSGTYEPRSASELTQMYGRFDECMFASPRLPGSALQLATPYLLLLGELRAS